MRTQRRTDGKIFLNSRNLWFENNANDPQDHQRLNDNNPKANPEDNQPALLNEKQEYLQQSINEYEEGTNYGSEISWCIAGASKIFWMKLMQDDFLKLKLELKLESNTFKKTQNQHQNDHTGKELIGPMRIHQTTSPLQRPRRGPIKDNIKK